MPPPKPTLNVLIAVEGQLDHEVALLGKLRRDGPVQLVVGKAEPF